MELVRRRLVGSRSEAQRAIEAGLVRVGTNAEPKASTLVSPDEPVHVVGTPEPFVSRAGRKLAGALETWGESVVGAKAVDIGASTGGFTDCLLQGGAVSVVAVDVGYGQLHWRIRQDARVTVVERTNIRLADPSDLGAPFDVIVADLSFISLGSVATSLAGLGSPGARWFLLIKPQFEVGREGIGKGGVVRSPEMRRSAVAGVVAALAEVGLKCRRLAVSSITGARGNIEYMTLFTMDVGVSRGGMTAERAVDDAMIERITIPDRP
jgi:23S rRNA (cytidine1920-2'-O)/16S rRNA (cytidine1409-2'-O)-methyltransferase